MAERESLDGYLTRKIAGLLESRQKITSPKRRQFIAGQLLAYRCVRDRVRAHGSNGKGTCCERAVREVLGRFNESWATETVPPRRPFPRMGDAGNLQGEVR